MIRGAAVVGGSGGDWRFSRICCSVLRVATSLSASGDRGESELGLFRAVMRLLAAAITRSVLDATGIATWWGNHAAVSVILVASVGVEGWRNVPAIFDMSLPCASVFRLDMG